MGQPISQSVAKDDATDHDARLASLIELAMDEVRRGRKPDLERLAAEAPELLGELRELWAAAALAEEFGSLSGEAIVDTGESATRRQPAEFADFELLEELGRGGMGVVYRARQKSLGRVVALKMVLRGETASKADLARFRGEAESAARLRHPHIVPVFEVGEHDGAPFFCMQYVDGTTLAERLAGGPLPGKEAARILAPVAKAIAEAHRQGVLHRDLKPSNILIDVDGWPFVSDFGLAKRIAADARDDDSLATLTAPATQAGAILGTPGYMSPEQAAGNRGSLGPATDVYSLGAILYAMLTGRPPFQGASPVATVLMVLEQDPVPPRLLNPQADRDLEMIALKCLQKPVELRYAGAADVAADLEAYLANEPVAARSGKFTQVIMRTFSETHHISVMENWGLLWMLHGIVLLVVCVATNIMQLSGVESRWPYIALWSVGLGAWAVVFWSLRRRGGPITFVERQIAHVWAGSILINVSLYAIEWQLGLPVLKLSPVLGPVSGIVFLVKAAMLSGTFYIQAATLFVTGVVMAWLAQQTAIPNIGLSVFGVVSAISFIMPGWKYYRQMRT
ncbi:MAG: serine/threonine-protein kinase [Pirellulales bacterium]